MHGSNGSEAKLLSIAIFANTNGLSPLFPLRLPAQSLETLLQQVEYREANIEKVCPDLLWPPRPTYISDARRGSEKAHKADTKGELAALEWHGPNIIIHRVLYVQRNGLTTL